MFKPSVLQHQRSVRDISVFIVEMGADDIILCGLAEAI